MDVRKQDFVAGAFDGLHHVHANHLPHTLRKHHEETGAIDWYTAGQIVAARMMDNL